MGGGQSRPAFTKRPSGVARNREKAQKPLFYRARSDIRRCLEDVDGPKLTKISWGFPRVPSPESAPFRAKRARSRLETQSTVPRTSESCNGGTKKRIAVAARGRSKTARGLFAQPVNLLSPSCLRLPRERRTGADSNTGLASGNSTDYTSPVLSTRAQD